MNSRQSSLVSNPLQRSVIIETEVAGVDDVICARLLREIVERSQIA